MKNYEDILRLQEYDGLWVCRTGRICSLMIDANGECHVYADANGKTLTFRHAWQIKEWLRQKYSIEVDRLEVKTFRVG